MGITKKYYVLYFRQHVYKKSKLNLCVASKTRKQYNLLTANSKFNGFKIGYISIRKASKGINFSFYFLDHSNKIYANNFYSSQLLILRFTQFIGHEQWN